jgi:hypothetical protein
MLQGHKQFACCGTLAPSYFDSLSLVAAHSAIENPSHSFMMLAASTAPKKALTYSLICSGTSKPSTFCSQHMADQKKGTTFGLGLAYRVRVRVGVRVRG